MARWSDSTPGSPSTKLFHELARRSDDDRNLKAPLQRGEAAQLAFRIDTTGILKPLPRIDVKRSTVLLELACSNAALLDPMKARNHLGKLMNKLMLLAVVTA